MTLFTEVKAIYIADGHHRTAAAVKVGIERGQAMLIILVSRSALLSFSHLS